MIALALKNDFYGEVTDIDFALAQWVSAFPYSCCSDGKLLSM